MDRRSDGFAAQQQAMQLQELLRLSASRQQHQQYQQHQQHAPERIPDHEMQRHAVAPPAAAVAPPPAGSTLASEQQQQQLAMLMELTQQRAHPRPQHSAVGPPHHQGHGQGQGHGHGHSQRQQQPSVASTSQSQQSRSVPRPRPTVTVSVGAQRAPPAAAASAAAPASVQTDSVAAVPGVAGMSSAARTANGVNVAAPGSVPPPGGAGAVWRSSSTVPPVPATSSQPGPVAASASAQPHAAAARVPDGGGRKHRVPWNRLKQGEAQKLLAIKAQLESRMAHEFPNNFKGSLEYLGKNHANVMKMGKTLVADLIAEMYDEQLELARQQQRERALAALQARNRQPPLRDPTLASAPAQSVIGGDAAKPATPGILKKEPKVEPMTQSAPAATVQPPRSIVPTAVVPTCSVNKCTLRRVDGGLFCVGHTCKTVGCFKVKSAASPLCHLCASASSARQHEQASHRRATSAAAAAAPPLRPTPVPKWAAPYKAEWDSLEEHRRKVTDMMIRLYESITKNTVAPPEALKELEEANAHRVIADRKPGRPHDEAFKIRSFLPPDPPDPIMSQVPIATFLVAREAKVAHRLAERSRQLSEAEYRDAAIAEAASAGEMEIEGGADAPTVQEKIERKALALLRMQRALRANIVACERTDAYGNRGRLTTKTHRNDNAKLVNSIMKLQGKLRDKEESLRRKEEMRWLHELIEHRKKFIEFHKEANSSRHRQAHAVIAQIERKAKDAQRKEAKEDRERLALLRMNDEEGYRALIDKEKHGRLAHLLDKTDEYMSQMMSQITDHQQAAFEQEDDDGVSPEAAAPAAAAAAPASDGPSRIRSAATATFTEDDLERIAEGQSDASFRSMSGPQPVRSKFGEAHKIVEPVTEQASIMVNGRLKEYQVRGLEWMVSLYNNKLNGILADEMGLGKTVQSISLITYLMEKKGNMGPYLIVLPLSTLTNWVLEFDKWAPSVSYIAYKGKNRQALYAKRIRSLEFNVVITTFEFILADKALLGKINWKYLIIDEGHRLKNKDSKLAKALSKYYKTPRRLLLSGTPLQNNLTELWALLNFLLPQIFKSADSFDEWFAKPFAASGEKVELTQEERMLIVQRLHKVLRPFLLRRLKSEVENQLPEKVEHVLKCGMSALQTRLYHHMKAHDVILSPPDTEGEKPGPDGAAAGGHVTYMRNQIMQLRKICNHPFLFRAVDEGFAKYRGYRAGSLNEDLWRSCGKFELLDRILPKLFRTNHKCLLFSQMKELLTVIEDFCNFKGIKYLKLDGNTRSEERGQLIETFNKPESPYMLFILSTRAGGLGLNLQAADTVIIYDSDWNPSADAQAQDRAHRIGQQNEVRVFRLITVNSIEEQILETARFKLQIDDQVIQAGKYNQSSSDSDRKEYLQKLLMADDTEAETDEDVSIPNDSELNRMLARRPGEFELYEQMDREATTRSPGPRLLTDDDLPPWMIRSDGAVAWQAGEKDRVNMNLGRGNRVVEKRSYKIPTEADVYAKPDPVVEADAAAAAAAAAERKRKALAAQEAATPPPPAKRPRPEDSPASEVGVGPEGTSLQLPASAVPMATERPTPTPAAAPASPTPMATESPAEGAPAGGTPRTVRRHDGTKLKITFGISKKLRTE